MKTERPSRRTRPTVPAAPAPGGEAPGVGALLHRLTALGGAVRVYRGEGDFLLLHLAAAGAATTGQPESGTCPAATAPTASVRVEPAGTTRSLGRAAAGDDFVMRLYLREARAEPVLTEDEALELGWLARFGDATAREQLVRGHLRLVVHIALEYRGHGLPLADLVNEGNLGLMRAAELFDPFRGQRFANYAGTWIRQRMRRALSYQAWPVRLPAALAWQRNRVARAERALRSGGSRNLAVRDVAETSGLPITTVQRLRAAPAQCFVSLEEPAVATAEDALTVGDALADEVSPGPDEDCARQSDGEFLGRLLATLDSREQCVLRLRFGLDDDQPRTLEEVGQRLGYVRQAIQKIEAAALAKLRAHVRWLELVAAQALAPTPASS